MSKLKLTLLFSLVLAILIIQSVLANTLINIYIDETGKAEFLGESSDNLSLPDGISINQGKIRGTTNSLTSKSGEIWTFSSYLQGSEMNIILPDNAIIKNTSSSEIYLKGKRLSIYAQDSIDISYAIEDNNSNNLLWLLIVIILIFVIFILYKLYLRKIMSRSLSYNSKIRELNKKNKLAIMKDILNERDNLILDNLRKTGKTKMSYLRKLTNMPKASFSRHIQELEKKKLVQRFGEGKNKFVKLNK